LWLTIALLLVLKSALSHLIVKITKLSSHLSSTIPTEIRIELPIIGTGSEMENRY